MKPLPAFFALFFLAAGCHEPANHDYDSGLDAGDGDSDGDVDGDVDGDIDGDVDGDADADGDEPPPPESCDFGYDEMFPTAAPPPPGPAPEPDGDDRTPPADEPDGIDYIVHPEPLPPSTTVLRPKDPGDFELVIPDYHDDMPLFPRAGAWDTERRCYETPRGVELLTEPEAYDLYRSIAELTTGVPMPDEPGVRSVVGLRGAYPGTFAWHGNTPDFFNDTLVLLWIDHDGQHHVREFPVHTDVGARDFGENSSSSLRPNRRYHHINGWHRSTYNALYMIDEGYRVRDDTNHNGHWDSDRNGWLPPRTANDRDRIGGAHNIHTGQVEGSLGTARVGGNSAGCQVIPGMANWIEFIEWLWTGEGDVVEYFLIDVRDIAPDVWEPCAERDGTHRCPFHITSFPYIDSQDTTGWPVDEFDVYNCSTADESGPEVVYMFTIDRRGTLAVTVDCPDGVDIDIHLLDGDDPNACLARGHTDFEYSITEGRYFVVADTYVESGTELGGSYTLTVDLL